MVASDIGSSIPSDETPRSTDVAANWDVIVWIEGSNRTDSISPEDEAEASRTIERWRSVSGRVKEAVLEIAAGTNPRRSMTNLNHAIMQDLLNQVSLGVLGEIILLLIDNKFNVKAIQNWGRFPGRDTKG